MTSNHIGAIECQSCYGAFARRGLAGTPSGAMAAAGRPRRGDRSGGGTGVATGRCACALSREDDRQVIVIMAVTVADAGSVDNRGVIQTRAIRLLDGLHLLQYIRQLRHMEGVDSGAPWRVR